jgi:hypothetical protein
VTVPDTPNRTSVNQTIEIPNRTTGNYTVIVETPTSQKNKTAEINPSGSITLETVSVETGANNTVNVSAPLNVTATISNSYRFNTTAQVDVTTNRTATNTAHTPIAAGKNETVELTIQNATAIPQDLTVSVATADSQVNRTVGVIDPVDLPAIRIQNLSMPPEAYAGQTVTATATLNNTNTTSETATVVFSNTTGGKIKQQPVTLTGGGNETTTVNITSSQPGTVSVTAAINESSKTETTSIVEPAADTISIDSVSVPTSVFNGSQITVQATLNNTVGVDQNVTTNMSHNKTTGAFATPTTLIEANDTATVDTTYNTTTPGDIAFTVRAGNDSQTEHVQVLNASGALDVGMWTSTHPQDDTMQVTVGTMGNETYTVTSLSVTDDTGADRRPNVTLNDTASMSPRSYNITTTPTNGTTTTITVGVTVASDTGARGREDITTPNP